MASHRKVLLPSSHFSEAPQAHLHPAQWDELKRCLPTTPSAQTNAILLRELNDTCELFYMEREYLREGAEYARIMRSPGKRQSAPFKKLAMGLRSAADAWKIIRGSDGPDMMEFGLSFERLEALETMAQLVENRFRQLSALGRPEGFVSPWTAFVRGVAQCLCRASYFNPARTGRIYEIDVTLTWFQEFMLKLNLLLPEEAREPSANKQAFAARVNMAMKGFRCASTRPKGKPKRGKAPQ